MRGGHDPECRGGFPWDSKDWNQGATHVFEDAEQGASQFAEIIDGDFEITAAQGNVLALRRSVPGKAINNCHHAGTDSVSVP